MNNIELVNKLQDIATNYKTIYALGTFGWPTTKTNVDRAINAQTYNKNRQSMLEDLIGQKYFMFDCINLIKAVLWGWSGDSTKNYGGAIYDSNDVPDINDAGMIARCVDVSSNFSTLQIGEFVWMQGHCGIYIGNGLAIECSPKWKNGVQITACNCDKSGYNRRNWTKHGKIPYITYTQNSVQTISIELPVLKRGTKNQEIGTLQVLLNSKGYTDASGASLVVDCSFGPKVEFAVRKFQKEKGLEIDSVVGKQTWTKLLRG